MKNTNNVINRTKILNFMVGRYSRVRRKATMDIHNRACKCLKGGGGWLEEIFGGVHIKIRYLGDYKERKRKGEGETYNRKEGK